MATAKKDPDILVVVFGRGNRVYARRYFLKAWASKFPGACARRESLKAEAEGYRVLPVFDFEQIGGVYIYRLNYTPIEPTQVVV